MASGTRIDFRHLDLESLEVDQDVLIRGNLTVQGTLTVSLITTYNSDVEITPPNQLKTDYISEYTAGAGITVTGDLKIGSTNKLWFGTDVNLYRGGADILRTDDSIDINRPNANIYHLALRRTDSGAEWWITMGANSFRIARYSGTGSLDLCLDGAGNVQSSVTVNIGAGITNILGTPADATNTLQDSFKMRFTGYYWSGTSSLGRSADIFHRILSTTPTSEIVFQIAGTDYLTVGDNGIVASVDINIGANKIKTTTVLIKEEGTGVIAIRDSGDTDYRNISVKNVFFTQNLTGTSINTWINTQSGATSTLEIRSHDGTAYVTNLKLIGGYVEIYNGKLTSNLNANNNKINNLYWIHGGTATTVFYILGGRTSSSPGDAISLQTKNATEVYTDRVIITGGVDIADIKIVNAYLDFNDQTLASTAGTLAGYIIIKVGGTQYKVPVYNLA